MQITIEEMKKTRGKTQIEADRQITRLGTAYGGDLIALCDDVCLQTLYILAGMKEQGLNIDMSTIAPDPATRDKVFGSEISRRVSLNPQHEV